jgi:hypothetical protein
MRFTIIFTISGCLGGSFSPALSFFFGLAFWDYNDPQTFPHKQQRYHIPG